MGGPKKGVSAPKKAMGNPKKGVSDPKKGVSHDPNKAMNNPKKASLRRTWRFRSASGSEVPLRSSCQKRQVCKRR